MKILHVITTINRGGAENHLAELITGQREEGHEIAVAYMKGDGYWATYLEKLGAEVFSLEMPTYFRPSGLRRLHRIVQEVRPDLLHAHMPPSSLLCRGLLALPPHHSLPFFISVHNDAPFFESNKIEAFRNWVYGRATKVICISEAVKRYAAQFCTAQVKEKLETIHYGLEVPNNVSCKETLQIRSKLGANEGTFVIGTVSRLTEQKALDSLLVAFEIFRKRNPIESHLVIIGRGPLEASLKHLSKTLGLEDHVTWIPYTDQVFTWISAMDVFVLNSIYEGFGLVLLEAMAMGKPIIGSTAGAIPEVVEDGETGIIVRARDTSLLAQTLGRLVDISLRQEMGANGKQRLLTKFSRKRMVAATTRTYRSEPTLTAPARMAQGSNLAIKAP